ncbi:MAG: helix-turn-helix transcriptional regulator [Fibrobacteres bacterium]|nr:helix-turn-helix transcriptional regulator [Fibrobacterota bacterium]
MSKVTGVRILHSVERENYLSYAKEKLTDRRIINTILIVNRGEIIFDNGRKKIRVCKNDIVCHKQNTITERCLVPGKSASYRLIHCEISGIDNGSITVSDIGLPFVFQVKRPIEVHNIMRDIHKKFHSGTLTVIPECSALGLELIIKLFTDCTNVNKTEKSAIKPLHTRIRDALNYINLNYKTNIKVPAVAASVFMHPSYFTHLFTKEVGMSPHRYITEFKISKAKEFLISFDAPLSYTGLELGFHDHSHFYKVFRQITGETPGEYIRRMKTIYDPKV